MITTTGIKGIFCYLRNEVTYTKDWMQIVPLWEVKMVNTIKVSPESITKSQEPSNLLFGQSEDIIAQCPLCKTIETVTVGGDSQLITTRKFYQSGKKIYHKCGSAQPCRLFRGQ